MQVFTIGGVNRLPDQQKRAIYTGLIPIELLSRYNLNRSLIDQNGNDLLKLKCEAGSTSVEMEVRHLIDFPDPNIYYDDLDFNAQIDLITFTVRNMKQNLIFYRSF